MKQIIEETADTNSLEIEGCISVEFYLIDAFEIFHFLPLYYLFDRNELFVKFVAEPPNVNTSGKWFDYDQAIEILERNQVRYSKECNPDCDYAFTTQDAKLLNKYRNKKVHVSYGFSFTNYSFCESAKTLNGFDYKLVHGKCTYKKLKDQSNIPRVYIMGYPKHMWNYPVVYGKSFDLEEEINRKNVENKPVLVYFPTWDSGSSISLYGEEIAKLKERFFIVTKAHHCTFRLRSEQERKDTLYRISDIVCDGNYEFERVAKMGEIAICDAISGAASEVPLVNRNVDLLLLYSPIPEKNDFKKEISVFAYCVQTPEELVTACNAVYGHDCYKERRRELLEEIFQSTNDTCLEEFINIMQSKKK